MRSRAGVEPISSVAVGGVVLRQPPLFMGEPLAESERRAVERATGRPVLHGERCGDGVAVVTETGLSPTERRALAAVLGGALAAYGLDEIVGMIAGLEDAHGELLGLGVVRSIDFAEAAMVVDTPVPVAAIAVATVGRERSGLW
jgi:polynucleotide 5'-kinase involved in rRNA processing